MEPYAAAERGDHGEQALSCIKATRGSRGSRKDPGALARAADEAWEKPPSCTKAAPREL